VKHHGELLCVNSTEIDAFPHTGDARLVFFFDALRTRKVHAAERIRTTRKWNFATKHVNISFSPLLYTMRPRISFSKPAFLGLYIVITAFIPVYGQGTPRQEKLLNGLRVLMWSQPTANKVEVKLRIHAGAAFDPQQKEGTMCMLAEALFPTNESREFFAEDLGGSFRIVCNYDYVEIDATSKPESYLTMIETIAGAVSSPAIDRQTTEAARARALTIVTSQEKDTGYLADIAVQRRLFGTFPYGRPVFGNASSLKNIDFADLRFAYDRLFGADNATIAISGNFPSDVAYRATRRYFGSWLKSDKKVPSTFRQPDAPPIGTQILESPEAGMTEIRYAVRGVARNDRDFAAARILSKILEQRVKMKADDGQRENVWVRNYSNILPGVVIVGFSRIQKEMTAAVTSEHPKPTGDVIAAALSDKISETELAAARAAVLAEFNAYDIASQWLDADTFRLQTARSEQLSLQSVSVADVQSFADRLKLQPVASVVLLGQKTSN
jgi:predicted Zn-dependent peptidase